MLAEIKAFISGSGRGGIGGRLTRWGRVYSWGMADFTFDEVMEIVDKLRGADLRGLDLSDARMQNANLPGADLQLTPGTEASCVGTETFVQAVAVQNMR